jgi:hypothetical protein
MSCTSGTRGHLKRRKLRRWVVSVCVCVFVSVCVWCPSLLCGFPTWFVREVLSCLYDTHQTDTLGRNWYIGLTVGLTTRDATDPHEADTLGRNWYIGLTVGLTARDATDPHEADALGRNWYIGLTVGLTTRDANDPHEADTLGRNWYVGLTVGLITCQSFFITVKVSVCLNWSRHLIVHHVVHSTNNGNSIQASTSVFY